MGNPEHQARSSAPGALTDRMGRRRGERVLKRVAARQSAEDRDAHSGQRLIDIADVPARTAIRRRRARRGRRAHRMGERRRAGVFELDWLARTPPAARRAAGACAPLAGRRGTRGARDFAWASLAELRTPAVRLAWLTRLLQEGLAFLRRCPRTEAPCSGRCRSSGAWSRPTTAHVRRAFGAAAGESCILGSGPRPAYRQSVSRAGPRLPGPACTHSVNRRRREHVRRWLRARGTSARGDPDAFALLTRLRCRSLSFRGCGALCGAAPDSALLPRRVLAVHYNSRSIAPLALSARAAPLLCGLPVFAALMREARWQLRIRLDAGMWWCSTISASCTAARRSHRRGTRGTCAAVISRATVSIGNGAAAPPARRHAGTTMSVVAGSASDLWRARLGCVFR